MFGRGVKIKERNNLTSKEKIS